MNQKRETEWTEAKKHCHLSDEALQMARELGMNPDSLIKNIPNKSEPWKAPVEDWVRRNYRKRFHRDHPVSKQPAPPPELPLPEPLETESARETPPTTATAPVTPKRNLYKEAQDEMMRRMQETDSEEEMEVLEYEMRDIERHTPVSEGEIEEEDEHMLRRWNHFRDVAQYIARALGNLPQVENVTLFGSVSLPLKKEIPRFFRLRRARAAIWHECNDIDLAVWINDLASLRELRKAVSHALNEALHDFVNKGGVAVHQVDVHLFEPRTHRYRGRLCMYANCPKGKQECEAAGCGAQPFLQQFNNYEFKLASIFDANNQVLFERSAVPPDPECQKGSEDVPFL